MMRLSMVYLVGWSLLVAAMTWVPSMVRSDIGTYNLLIEFSFDTNAVPDKTVTEYRMYKDGEPICNNAESGNDDGQLLDCTFESLNGTYDFTMAAVYDDGSESPQSAAYTFELPDVGRPVGVTGARLQRIE